MRATLDTFLSRIYNDNIYLIHGDMWTYDKFVSKFPQRVINCGIQEPNMVNIAAGLASQGKTVIVYGVAGMVIHRAYEQIKLNVKGWAENYGHIIFVNAGHNGCYSDAGRGHLLDDDHLLCDALKIPLHEPQDRRSFLRTIKECIKQPTGVDFVRLGYDNGSWIK